MIIANSRASSLQAMANAGFEPNAQIIQNKNSACKVAAVALGALILGLAVGSSLALFAHISLPIACITGASSTALFISAYAMCNFFKKSTIQVANREDCDLQSIILSYLPIRDLAICARLDRHSYRYGMLVPADGSLLPKGHNFLSRVLRFRKPAVTGPFFNRLWKPAVIREIVIGQKEWQKHLSVDIGEVPELPDALCRELFLPDPSSSGKFILQTHSVIAIPEKYTKADGTEELVTFSNYGKLIAHKFPKRWPPAAPVDPAVAIPAEEAPIAAAEKRGYDYFWDDAWQEHKDKGTGEKTHWLLIKTDKILPETEWLRYPEKETLVTAYNARNQKSMEISSALPTIIAFTMQFFRTGQFPLIYVCCKETSVDPDWHLVVGGSASRGPFVHFNFNCGVALSRKF